MKTTVRVLGLLFTIILLLDELQPGATQEVTFNNYTYTVHTTGAKIAWENAETKCVDLGGHLATINSKQIDSLLYYLTTAYSCWIGLNDNTTEAGTDASAFVWVDGSTSTYRQFATITNGMGTEPSGTFEMKERDCVDFRFGNDGSSDGWDDRECNANVFCYFCQKSGDSRGCDLIYEGSCYRAFEVSVGISWLDAQSSCVVWGGDLTSITTERENNLLYTAVNDTVSNFWIGLYERDGDGMYQWVDGTVMSLTNWTGTAPTPDSTHDCVQMDTNGAGMWIAADCEATSNSFICIKPSSSTITTAGRFGELINGGKNFQELSGNTFYFNSSLTLVCGGEQNSNAIQWKYSQQSDLTSSQTLTPTYASTVTGLSWMTVNNSQQGYYRCEIDSSLSYTIGLYDLSLTTVAVSGGTYTYIVGVDRQDVLLLCDPMDSSVTLSMMRWKIDSETGFPNPISLYSLKDSLPETLNIINCSSSGIQYTSVSITLLVPVITIKYGTMISETFSSVYPAENLIAIPISTRDISISINIDGTWNLPNSSTSSNFELTIPILSTADIGLYKFYVTNWDGEEQLAMQSNIVLANTVVIQNFDSPTQQVNYTAGDTSSMLYYSHASIPDSSLRWTTDTVTDGADTQYSIEYPNPVLLSRVFSDVGGGVHTLSCFYRMSPVTLQGSIMLVIKDTVTINVTYDGNSSTFNDATNPKFPSPEQITITEGTNVTFSCNLTECIWVIESQNSSLATSKSPLIIPMITKSDSGNYSLLRTTHSGINYTTANISIYVKPKDINSMSLIIIITAIGIILVVLAICLAVILITICLVVKRRKVTPFPKQSLIYENDTQIMQNNKTVKDPIELNTHCYSKLNESEIEETTSVEHHSQRTDYENIEDIGNKPFHDESYEEVSTQYQEISEVVNQQSLVIPLDLYKTHINKLWQKEGSLLEEYESLGGKSHKHSCTIAVTEMNGNKNRFRLIFPYDKSRVILGHYGNGGADSDYINASHIPGSYAKENFIAAQAPKENTVQEFWQMITENKIVNIVMVTNLVESGRRKSEEYFPLKFGEFLIIGPYEIVLDAVDIMIGYTIRKMSIQFMGKTAKIKHFHFTAWPDHDVPTLYHELLLFVSKVQEGLIKSKAPILVHCSAGVGRTGTFITLYNLLAAIQQGKPISIYAIVHEMREHRPQMVQTFAQYKFIYLSVLEMLLGNTSIPTADYLDTFNLYMQSEHEGYVSVFFQQYSELNYQCEKGFEHICDDALEDSNSNKNPIKDILPCDINRVELCSQHWSGSYINATSVDNGEFLITIHPTRETLRDFHQLIYQMEPSLVVMLCTKRELQLIEQNKSKRVVYWQSYDEPQEGNPFVLTSKNTDKSAFIRNNITMKHSIDGCNRTFTQIIVNHWTNKDEPDLKKSVTLLETMLEYKRLYPTSPIIIHCIDGAGKSAVIYTVYRAIRDSIEKGYIDIFHIVKKLRKERMKSITNLAYFVACYTLMNEYCFKMQ